MRHTMGKIQDNYLAFVVALFTAGGASTCHSEQSDVLGRPFEQAFGFTHFLGGFRCLKRRLRRQLLAYRAVHRKSITSESFFRNWHGHPTVLDQLPPDLTKCMIKYRHSSILQLAFNLLNRVSVEDYIPVAWITAIVLPLIKQKKVTLFHVQLSSDM